MSKYRCLDMQSLRRLILLWDQKASEEWTSRYGHGYPVYAIVDGKELKLEN